MQWIATATMADVPSEAGLPALLELPKLLGAVPVPLPGTNPDAAEVPTWIWILLVIAGTIATITDLRSMRIPNWLTLPLLGTGLCHGLLTAGVTGLGAALLGAAAAGVMFVVAYAMLGGGAGDAKLMLAFGSWLGLDASVTLVLAVTIVGFILAIGVVIFRNGIRDVPAVVFVGVLRTAGGLLLLRKGMMPSLPATTPAAGAGNTSPSGTDGPKTDQPGSSSSRPKGWLPYAPAILGGVILSWVYLALTGSGTAVH